MDERRQLFLIKKDKQKLYQKNIMKQAGFRAGLSIIDYINVVKNS